MSVCKYYFFLMEYSECVQVVSYIDLWSSFNFLFNMLRVIYALCTYTLSM